MTEIYVLVSLILGSIVFAILLIQVVYLLIFSVAGIFYREKPGQKDERLNSFIIYIPSYKEDAVILKTAEEALKLDYPSDLFHVVVIADSLQPTTIESLKTLPLQVVEVKFEKSTKAKALNRAIEETRGSFDIAVVFDADNVAAGDYLLRMNSAFNRGFKVVQGQRTAKNTDTPMALLDAISEAINNHIFRKGHRVLGLSSAIIGSGMGLDFNLYKSLMAKIKAIGGFDKEMELNLLKDRILIDYSESAVVYDEKVKQTEVFEKQRQRWLSAQLNYLRHHALSGLVYLFTRGNLDYFDKVFQMAIIPRVMLLALLPLCFLCSLFPGEAPSFSYWLAVWIIGYLSIILAVPAVYYNKKLISALVRLPSGIFSTFKLLFKLKGANRTFIHTPHGDVTVKQKNDKL
ncbi:MAG: glycosyltransferase [Sphingobacteriia bacterium]|nr:glycosyltransferase [Sphingobacteriia bacterium]